METIKFQLNLRRLRNARVKSQFIIVLDVALMINFRRYLIASTAWDFDI